MGININYKRYRVSIPSNYSVDQITAELGSKRDLYSLKLHTRDDGFYEPHRYLFSIHGSGPTLYDWVAEQARLEFWRSKYNENNSEQWHEKHLY